jgi:fibronectin type 3 domain-containing protein
VDGGLVDPEKSRQGTYATSLLRSGHKYFFKVHARTSWWAASADSNVVSFIWHIPAKGPEGLSTKAADTSATISWQAVTNLMDGEPVDYPLSYQVLRSKDNKNFAAIGSVTSKTAFVDNSLLNGEKYFFKVQSILNVDKNAISGGISKSVSVVPFDLTPPSAPTGVTAVQTGAGIKIFWEKSHDADVKGYRIYRRGGSNSTASKIGEVAAVYAIFEDTNVDADTSYYYTVTAFDKAESANESVKSREASIRH